MNRVAKIGLGCLLLPIGTVVLGLVFFLVFARGEKIFD